MRAASVRPWTLLVLLLCAVTLPVWGDTVYLKNGSIIKGQIVEHTPEVSYKIRTSDGSIFVFEAGEILKVEFEPAVAAVSPSVALGGIPGRKDPWLAVLGSLMLPTAGHAYAGNWIRGLPFGLAEVAAAALVFDGLGDTGKEETRVDERGNVMGTWTTDSGQWKVTTGLVALLAAGTWECFDAYTTAEDHNRDLEKRYSLSFQTENRHPRLAFTYSF
jgi:hypothetical protein